ncbi:hypothetical protein CEE37_05220 [candidate division LCP-89 bacterium B3_LCP]|uniref:Secretion system C-terminal sorting domain-containing protein n=1 Tax=candidate division LCP-89 bacterium B3_LCP TaxID=2012998 RepID=A0A532V1M3_UNCL8|nr:MAG: hypothetical protein CEE37_05220 [candidate division LCP-89 bacterium B3_LCP]
MNRTTLHVILYAGFIILLLAGGVTAQDSLNVTMMSRIYAHWLSTEDVAVSGDYAYVASTGLRVIDISDPAHPVEVGYCLTPGFCYDVVVSGEYAYVANNYDGLRIIDVTNPSNPVETGFCDTPGRAHGVDVQGDYAYVSDYNWGMRIIDVSDPANPVEVGHFEHENLEDDVVVSGDYAYLAAWGTGLRIVDISDPTDPMQVGICDTPGWALGVALQGRFAYIADGDNGLRVIDVMDPTNPFEVGSYVFSTSSINAYDVAVSGNHAYVVTGGSGYTWYDGLRVIDISNPSNPDAVGYCQTPNNALGVFISGEHAYVATQCWGLRIINIADPEEPVEISYCHDNGYIYDIAVSGDIACVTDEPAGLRIVDVADPTSPVEMGIYDTPGDSREVAVQDHYAYIAEGNAGMRVVNFFDPANPIEVGSCGAIGDVESVDVSGDYAYTLSQGLYVIDVSDPTNPIRTGYYEGNWYYETDIAVSGDFAYLSVCDGGLQIIDISQPSNPSYIGSCNAGWLRGVAVDGDYAYVTDQDGLIVIDVSDPSAPFQTGFCDLVSCTFKVTVSGSYAYVSAEYGGLRIVDISNPYAPSEEGYYDTPGGALGVTVSGDYIITASNNNLGIYQFSPPNLNITLTPIDPPVQIPANGGSFDFNITLSNGASIPQTFDVWTIVTMPDSTLYGPVLGPINLTLPDTTSIERIRTQNVPGGARSGTYTYMGHVGVYPDGIWDSDCFTFEKLETGDGVPIANWSNSGEPFEMWFTETQEATPSEFGIKSIHPNPFNPTTNIVFSLPVAGLVTLDLFDIAGSRVGVDLASTRIYPPGTHNILFDGSNLPSGIYFARLTAGDYTQTQKLVLLK